MRDERRCWIQAVAPLVVMHEADDEGDSTPETILTRLIDKEHEGPMHAQAAAAWAMTRIRVLTERVRVLEAAQAGNRGGSS